VIINKTKYLFPSNNVCKFLLLNIKNMNLEDNMKASVDPDLCTGCELCVDTCPEVFEMNGDVATAKKGPVPADAEDAAKEAAESCPAEAITIKE